MSLILTPEQDDAVRLHAATDYPEECCGALVGEIVGSANYVSLVIPLGNKHEDGHSRRFRISSSDLLQVEKVARSRKESIVGFYHSHPDCSAVPSEYDKAHAWEVYSYLIVEVREAAAVAARSWKLSLDENRFNEENVLVNRCILEAAAIPADLQNNE